MQFQFRSASQVLFGRGEHKKVATLVKNLGKRVFLVTGGASLARRGLLSPVTQSLGELCEHVEHATVSGEPEVGAIDELLRQCKDAGCDVVLAIGGGSVLDAGKAVAALSNNAGAAVDFLEDAGQGPPKPIAHPSLPMIAVPTTAGSGSEVTRNSVLKVKDLRVKRSLRSDFLFPRVAIVDPDLSESAPRHVAAAAGMDALTHLVEGYLSKHAQPMTDALALSGMRLLWNGLHTLAQAFSTAESPDHAAVSSATHEQVALASLWGGMVLANAGLGAVHGLVAPLGGLCEVAHGDGCACLLPATFAQNAKALQKRAPDHPATARFFELCRFFTDGKDDMEQATERLSSLRKRLGIAGLRAAGVSEGQFVQIVRQSRGGSMRSNPIELTDEELFEILRSS